MKKQFLLIAVLAVSPLFAQNHGGITSAMLSEISKGYSGQAADKAIRNAMATNSINVLATNASRPGILDDKFTDIVKTEAITDQKSSGRCWLFTGLNVLRAAAIEKHKLGKFQFSQNYCFFWDQLEKANLFLQAVIDTKKKPFDDRSVDWLFSHPISDGGTFTGVANLVMKYGVVPSDVMPETYSSGSTSQMRTQLANILRQYGLELRGAALSEVALESRKTEMLRDVYHVLALCLGVPPSEFKWMGKTYTPCSFYQELLGYNLNDDYVMIMNDPTREYGKVYEIQYDRHLYDGQNWKHVNLPVSRIKEMAVASIKGGEAMYFSCDVGKFLDRKAGLSDLANYDYESLLGVRFTMDKKQRVMTHASGSTHAMTLVAVDINEGKPVKWMVENSWGSSFGHKGNIIMTDEWFDEYMFRLVVHKKYVPEDILKMLRTRAELLPAWDPMFLGEN